MNDSPPPDPTGGFTQTQESMIFYPESGHSIQYGPSTEEQIPFSETLHTDSEITREIDAFIKHGERHHTGVPRRGHHRDSLLASRQLLQLATTTAMVVTDGSGSPSTVEEEQVNEDDGSETQIPALFLPPSPPPDVSITPVVLPQEPPVTQVVLPQPPGDQPPIALRNNGNETLALPSSSPPLQLLPALWSDCPLVYPEPKDIVEALQDLGKKTMKLVNGSRDAVTVYPKIQKLCTKVYQNIQSLYHPDGLTKNVTWGRDFLVNHVLMARKLAEITTLDVFFHPYSKNGGQVFIITNNPVHCGLNIAINEEFQGTMKSNLKKSKTSRTSNDGLRLSLALLDPKYREAVAIIMSNRKERVHSDISGDHVLHFFEELLLDFKDKNYSPPLPSRHLFGEINLQEVNAWDPNDPVIFELDRDASWLMETWKVYIRRKYKAALDRWNKETGSGNGQSWSFVNYCDRDSRWLVAVFLVDKEANFLLAHNAGGRMPSHLQMESGRAGSPGVSSTEDSDDRSRMTARKREAIEAINESKKVKANMNKAAMIFVDMCEMQK